MERYGGKNDQAKNALAKQPHFQSLEMRIVFLMLRCGKKTEWFCNTINKTDRQSESVCEKNKSFEKVRTKRLYTKDWGKGKKKKKREA